jgi:hypothetical protein
MSEIDELFDRWAKDHTAEDVDAIILYYRKQIAMYDAGVKPKRVEAEQIDMSKILQNIKQRQGLASSWKGASDVSNATGQAAIKPKGKGLRRI